MQQEKGKIQEEVRLLISHIYKIWLKFGNVVHTTLVLYHVLRLYH